MLKYPEKFKGKKIICFYSYYRPDGTLAYIVGRTADKEFPVYHLGPNRHWVNRKPAENWPYRLPELLKASPAENVFIVEGEKDCETLARFGLVVTSNSGGANASKAYEAWTEFFAGRKIFIIPDNDKAGLAHARKVTEILRPVVASVHTITLPTSRHKADVTDWIEQDGGDALRLLELVKDIEAAAALPEPPASESEADGFEPGDAFEGPAAVDTDECRFDESWKPFPVHLLPPEMAEYILETARMLSCDAGYVVLSSIVTMAAAIGNSRVCSLNDEWPEPSVVWGCLVAENSTLKSPAGDKGCRPLEDLHDEFVRGNVESEKQFKKEMEIWKLNGTAKKPDKAEHVPDPMPEQAPKKRIKVKDITVEKLVEIMAENPKGIALVTDELASWFGSFTRYKAAGIAGTDMPFWLEVIRAGRYDVDRMGRNRSSLHVRRAGCSVYGSIQHETLISLATNDFFASGFVARILFCMPPRCKKVFVRGGMDLGVKDRYNETFRKLYLIDGDGTYDPDRQGRPVHFSAKGMDAWEFDFFEGWADRQFASLGRMAGALAKLEAYCARFALMFALIDYVNGRTPHEEISAEHVHRAVEVVKWFADETARVYRMVETPLANLERQRVTEYIRSHKDGITPNRLFLANPEKYRSTSGAQRALDDLLAEELVRLEIAPTSPNGGSAKKVYFAV